MTRFLKVFLRDRLDQPVRLAGFGKHPAWDDHIDDIGLTTETLVITRRILYSEGIASQLSSGAWNRLEENAQVLEFDHRFVWSREAQSVIGGIWASSDGKGRGRFPIIVCLQTGVNGWRAIHRFLEPVETLGGRCQTQCPPTEAWLLVWTLEPECLRIPVLLSHRKLQSASNFLMSKGFSFLL